MVSTEAEGCCLSGNQSRDPVMVFVATVGHPDIAEKTPSGFRDWGKPFRKYLRDKDNIFLKSFFFLIADHLYVVFTIQF